MNKFAWVLIVVNLIWTLILSANVNRANRWADNNYIANQQTNNRIDRLERDIEQGDKSFALRFENEMNKRWNDFFPTLNPYPSNIQQILKR